MDKNHPTVIDVILGKGVKPAIQGFAIQIQGPIGGKFANTIHGGIGRNRIFRSILGVFQLIGQFTIGQRMGIAIASAHHAVALVHMKAVIG